MTEYHQWQEKQKQNNNWDNAKPKCFVTQKKLS